MMPSLRQVKGADAPVPDHAEVAGLGEKQKKETD